MLHEQLPLILLSFTEIKGYKFHTECLGNESLPFLIKVHGGPGQGYQYLKPLFLYPGEPVREWTMKFKSWNSIWKIVPYICYYPFVKRLDGREGYDFNATKIANEKSKEPPYNCTKEKLPATNFLRVHSCRLH